MLGTDWRTRVIRSMWIAVTVAVAVSVTTWVAAELAAGSDSQWFWSNLHENVSVGVEWNLPTWLASMLWASFGLTAWHLAAAHPARRGSWTLLAMVGFAASIDEYLVVHDRLSAPGHALESALGVDLGGATWVLVGGLIAVAVALSLVRFVWSLPVVTRRALLLGASLFILGAIGFEVVSSLLFEMTGVYDWTVMLAVHVEEALEFAGVVIALRGLTHLLPAGPPVMRALSARN